MPQELYSLLDLFWQIIQYCWEGIFAFFHLEEWLIRLFKNKDIPVWVMLITLIPFNTILIGVEIILFRQLRRFKRFFRALWIWFKNRIPISVRRVPNSIYRTIRKRFFKNQKHNGNKNNGDSPQFLLNALNGRPISRRIFFLLALLPECQKVGTFVFALQMEKFGWQGYAALCLGGGLRLTIIILSPMWVLWTVVIGALSLRVIVWAIKRFKKQSESTIIVKEEKL